MVETYTCGVCSIQPNCIILAISPANQDIATSDAMKLAREVDPHGREAAGKVPTLCMCSCSMETLERPPLFLHTQFLLHALSDCVRNSGRDCEGGGGGEPAGIVRSSLTWRVCLVTWQRSAPGAC